MSQDKAEHQDNVDKELVTAVYQAIANRRSAYDTLLWQVPSLSFAAQAFLFTIALGSSSLIARLISAFLAFINAAISIQLMSKHRYHEKIDSQLLETFEKNHYLNTVMGCPPHAKMEVRAKTVGFKPNWINSHSSHTIWISGLILFALASITIIITTFIDFFAQLHLL